jgi:hypothetical protein
MASPKTYKNCLFADSADRSYMKVTSKQTGRPIKEYLPEASHIRYVGPN